MRNDSPSICNCMNSRDDVPFKNLEGWGGSNVADIICPLPLVVIWLNDLPKTKGPEVVGGGG